MKVSCFMDKWWNAAAAEVGSSMNRCKLMEMKAGILSLLINIWKLSYDNWTECFTTHSCSETVLSWPEGACSGRVRNKTTLDKIYLGSLTN